MHTQRATMTELTLKELKKNLTMGKDCYTFFSFTEQGQSGGD